MSDGGPFHAAEQLKLLLVSRATGEQAEEADYKRLRAAVLSGPASKLAPAFLRSCRTTAEFWAFIKEKSGKYSDRRVILRDAFEPLLSSLEQEASPLDARAHEVLDAYDSDFVRGQWMKALERRSTDRSEGAITSARTLLESTCKHLLDDLGTAYAADADLPALYSGTRSTTTVRPS